MESVARETPLAESPASSLPDGQGGGLWERYLHVAQEEGSIFRDYSVVNMNGVITFAGLLAATVAACVVESYKSLSPDTNAQTIALLTILASGANATLAAEVTTQPFHAPKAAVVVNALWFVALVIAPACALLATLIQEWTRHYSREQARPRPIGTDVEQYARLHILVHMGVQRYGLDRVTWFTIALMHSAVIIFLVGLDIFLFPIHTDVALVVATTTGIAALLYVIASSIPLFDWVCPYRTPLTDLLSLTIVVPATFMSCLLSYCLLLFAAAHSSISQRSLSSPIYQALNPRLAWSFLQTPYATGKLLHAAARYLTARKPGKDLLIHVLSVLHNEAQEEEVSMSAEQLEFLWERAGPYALEHPIALQYIAHCLIDVGRYDVGPLFVGLRNHNDSVKKIAEALACVNSVFGAVGSVRLLQTLFHASTPNDELSQAITNEDQRWERVDAILDVFPSFVEQFGVQNDSAMKENNTDALVAFSSFRWSLILLWGRIQGGPRTKSEARHRLRRLFQASERAPSLRLLPLSSSDHSVTGELFAIAEDPSFELAYRNAFTLLEGARSCEWKGNWQNPDSPYFKHTTPGLWHWPQLFANVMMTRREHAASFKLFEVLEKRNLCAWKGPGSDFAIPLNAGLNEVTIRAVEDLTSLVDLRLPPRPATNSEYDIQDSSAAVTPSACNASSSSALRNAEEGNTAVQLIVTASESRESPGKGAHASLRECDPCK